MRILSAVRLASTALLGRGMISRNAKYVLLERLVSLADPTFITSDFGKLWTQDADFMRAYERFCGKRYVSAERKYAVVQLLRTTEHLSGDTAECGVFTGATSYMICRENVRICRVHHLFDSFAGLSKPQHSDGIWWRERDLSCPLEVVQSNLQDFGSITKFHQGWIPECFSGVEEHLFSFVHIDVDLFQPSLDSLQFFYPRVVSGGIIVLDDYGFETCPGEKAAADEFMLDKAERIVHLPTGQGVIFKR
jgi:hypothetical protein